MKIFFISLAILSLFNLEASELRLDRSGYSMSNVPVKNQGNFGTCYAYSTAQAVDAFVQGNSGTKFTSSPLMIAIRTKDTFWKRLTRSESTVDGGLTCSAFKRGDNREHEFCSEDVIEGDFKQLLNFNNDRRYSDIHSMIQNLEEIYKQYSINKKIEGSLEKYAQEIINFVAPSAKIKSNFIPSVEEAILALKSKNNLQFLNRLLSSRCERSSYELNHVRCENVRRSSINKKNEQKIINAIDNQLTQNTPQPVIISYCAEVLLSGKRYSGLKPKGKITFDVEKDCKPHASLIIGKRDVDNKVQYLVRNSWGKACYQYSGDWECDKGNIWVDQDAIAQNIFEVSTLHGK